jgi:hypothetical protein
MIWLVIVASASASAILTLLSLRLRLPTAVAGLISPIAAVALVFLVLRLKYTLFELGPFIIVPLVGALLLAAVVSWTLCFRAAGTSG